MSHPQVPLSDLCQDIVVGHVGPSSKHRDSDGIPFLMGKNIGPGYLKLDSLERVSRSFHEREKKSQLRPGDIVVVRIGQSGQAALIPQGFDEANCSGLVVIKKPRESVYAPYLVYYLNSPQGRSASLREAKGSTRSTLNTSSVSKALIPLPPLEEQRRIAAILDKADSIQRLSIKRESIWPKLARALFHEMFGGINSNPFRHRLVTLGELLSSAEVFLDGDWVESKDQDPNGDVRLVQLADIGDGFYVDKSSRFLTYEASVRLRCTYLKPGDVLVARMPDPLCRACIFPGDEKTAVTVVDVCIIRVDHALVDPTWLTWMINSAEFRANALRAASGTTRSRVSRGNLSRLPVLMPPLHDQRRFAQILARLFSLIGCENGSYSQVSASHIKCLASSLSANEFGGK